MPRTPPPVPMSESTANDLRKILAFASSAGKTISGADALEVIKSICIERLHGDTRAAAIVAHAERVALLLAGGDPFAADRVAPELLEAAARG